MENFGAVLKDIRISKNFRLKDLSCNEISESTISRFEMALQNYLLIIFIFC